MTRTTLDRRGVTWGVIAVAIALVLVVFGSAGLRWFDAALVGYLFGTLFAIFGVTYRYAVWLRRPPTAKLRQRGWQALLRRDLRAGARQVTRAGGGPSSTRAGMLVIDASAKAMAGKTRTAAARRDRKETSRSTGTCSRAESWA